MSKKDGIPFVGSNLALLLEFLSRNGRAPWLIFEFIASAFRSHKPTWSSLLAVVPESHVPRIAVDPNGPTHPSPKFNFYALRDIVRSGLAKGVIEEKPCAPHTSVCVERDDVKTGERTRLRITPLGLRALEKWRARDAAARLRVVKPNPEPIWGGPYAGRYAPVSVSPLPAAPVVVVPGKGGSGGGGTP